MYIHITITTYPPKGGSNSNMVREREKGLLREEGENEG